MRGGMQQGRDHRSPHWHQQDDVGGAAAACSGRRFCSCRAASQEGLPHPAIPSKVPQYRCTAPANRKEAGRCDALGRIQIQMVPRSTILYLQSLAHPYSSIVYQGSRFPRHSFEDRTDSQPASQPVLD